MLFFFFFRETSALVFFLARRLEISTQSTRHQRMRDLTQQAGNLNGGHGLSRANTTSRACGWSCSKIRRRFCPWPTSSATFRLVAALHSDLAAKPGCRGTRRLGASKNGITHISPSPARWEKKWAGPHDCTSSGEFNSRWLHDTRISGC